MSKARIGRYTALLALLGLCAIALGGCAFKPSVGTQTRLLPPDLPDNPDPTKKYCKVWVPPTYRKVPKLVMCKPPCTTTEEVTFNRTTAYEVMTKPAELRRGQTCGNCCDDHLVQTKPGGYRWENDGTCWQYKYRCPEYKWCKKHVGEESVKYCYEVPAEYETVARTEPVTKLRSKYVPAEYKIVYVNEVYTPGHWVWRPHDAPECECTPDRREWSQAQQIPGKCRSGCKKRALNCGCPTTN